MHPFDLPPFKDKIGLNDLAKVNLRGRVKEVETKVYLRDYELIENESTEDPKEIVLESYDQEGKLLENRVDWLDDQSSWAVVNSFDPQGRLREEYEYEDQVLIKRRLHEYDQEGRKILEESLLYGRYKQTNSNYKAYYVYDDSAIEEINRTLNCYESIQFINKAGQIRWMRSHEKGSGNLEGKDLLVEKNYSYDQKGLLKGGITQYFFPESGERYTEKHVYTYLSNGRKVQIKTESIPDMNVLSERKITYDERGNETAYEFAGNHDSFKVSRAFDDRNNLVTRVSGDAIMMWSYEYDQEGNWTRKSLVLANSRIVSEKRRITYYPSL